MKNHKRKKLPRFLVILIILLCILIALPLVLGGLSFIGRVHTSSFTPDGFVAYATIPNPATTTSHIMDHRGVDSLLADPVMSAIAPVVTGFRENRLLDNPLLRLVLNNSLQAVIYENSQYLLCYDMGLLSTIAKAAPMFLSRMDIPDLYYVTAGNSSRFELRKDDETEAYAGIHHNYIIVSNNRALFESIQNGSSGSFEEADRNEKNTLLKDYDAKVLINTRILLSGISPEDPEILTLLETLELPRMAEAVIAVETNKVDIQLSVPISSRAQGLQQILSKQSTAPSIHEYLPLTTQYATTVSAGSMEELINLARTVQGPSLDDTLKTAQSSSRFLLGLTLEELLYSWTGTEFAAFGLEGRPNPVFAVQISDEQQRRQVFGKLTSSFALTQDDSVVLDGVRIPNIRVPSFLLSLLKIWNISVPAQFYLVENNFLYFSQSPENLLDTVRSIRNNTNLIRQDVWKQLSSGADDRASVSLFYSLDRSVPFFLRGNNDIQRILKLYGRGLARIQFREDTSIISL